MEAERRGLEWSDWKRRKINEILVSQVGIVTLVAD